MCTRDLSSGGNQEAADDAEGAEEEEELQHLWMLPAFPVVIDWSCHYEFSDYVPGIVIPCNPVDLCQWICGSSELCAC